MNATYVGYICKNAWSTLMYIYTGLGPDSEKSKEYFDTDTLKKSKE